MKQASVNVDVYSSKDGAKENEALQPSFNKVLSVDEETGGVYPFVIFVIIGTLQLIGWNTLLNSIFSVYDKIFPAENPNHKDTITATYTTVNFFSTLLCIVYTRYLVKPVVTYIGLGLTAIGVSLYSLSTHLEYSEAYHTLHLTGAVIGISSALIGCSAFGYATYFRSNYSGALSAGLGVAGVISFAIYMLGKYAIFDDSIAETRKATWLLTGSSIFLCAFALVSSILFFNKPWVKKIMREKEQQQLLEQQKKHEVYAEDQVVETLYETFKATALISFLFFYTMFLTLFSFPLLAPISFGISPLSVDIVIGMFQIGDLIGRYTPNVVPFLLLKKKSLTIATFARTIFTVIYLITYGLQNNSFLNNLAVQIILMLLFAITNGWFITCCFIRIPDFVTSETARARCGSIALMLILLGLTSGQWVWIGIKNIWVR